MMKVYFSASLSRYRKLLPLTKDIASIIEDLGHEVASRHVTSEETTNGNWEEKYDPKRLFEREMRRLASSNILITEATTPSFGAGFLIQSAIALGKPILTLHYGIEEKNAPLMLRGHSSVNLQMYTEENIRPLLEKFFRSISKELVIPLEDFDQ